MELLFEDDPKIIDLGNGAECRIFIGDGKFWYLNGKYHRTDGPAVEWFNGNKFWFLNGKHHRDGGPAIEFANGGKGWLINDQYHRTDGPAVERFDGKKRWFIYGVEYTEEEFDQIKQVLWAV